MVPPDTVLFDVNETTLDLGPLGPAFERAFGDPLALPEWFGRLLQASAVCALTGVKATFRDLAQAGLERSAALFDRAPSPEARDALLAGFASLSPHPDVAPALERLRSAGYRTAAFSNSSSSLLEQQIRSAGLEDGFDALVSVEEVGSFKPDPAVYQHAARRMDRAPERCWMVAAHDWDVHGAMAAGLLGAYVARPRTPYHPAFRPPTVRGADLLETVDAILEARVGT